MLTNEQIERTIEFLLQSQAKHDAQIGILVERVDKLAGAVETDHSAIARLTDLVGRLAQAEIRLVERMDTLAQRMDALATAQKDTDGRLNALIVVVEKYISRRNGGTSASPAEAPR